MLERLSKMMGGGRRSLPTPPLGKLTEAERASATFSKTLEYRDITVRVPGQAARLKVGFMGPPGMLDAGRNQAPVPVAIAISGERQQHVSKFFQAWVPESRGWITATPLLPDYSPHFFKEPSDQLLHGLAQWLLEKLPVEGGKFHVLGTSNGGTSTVRFGCKWPELCHSCTVVTGTVTRADEPRLRRLAGIPVAIYAGDQDELGFDRAAYEMHQMLRDVGHQPEPELTILKGAGHFSVGQFINMAEFWARLESLRPHRGAGGAAAAQPGGGDAAAGAPAAAALGPGALVEVCGLQGKPELNGKLGRVMTAEECKRAKQQVPDPSSGRLPVNIEGRVMALRLECLRPAPGVAPTAPPGEKLRRGCCCAG